MLRERQLRFPQRLAEVKEVDVAFSDISRPKASSAVSEIRNGTVKWCSQLEGSASLNVWVLSVNTLAQTGIPVRTFSPLVAPGSSFG